jgi:hypothetical protein
MMRRGAQEGAGAPLAKNARYAYASPPMRLEVPTLRVPEIGRRRSGPRVNVVVNLVNVVNVVGGDGQPTRSRHNRTSSFFCDIY